MVILYRVSSHSRHRRHFTHERTRWNCQSLPLHRKIDPSMSYDTSWSSFPFLPLTRLPPGLIRPALLLVPWSPRPLMMRNLSPQPSPNSAKSVSLPFSHRQVVKSRAACNTSLALLMLNVQYGQSLLPHHGKRRFFRDAACQYCCQTRNAISEPHHPTPSTSSTPSTPIHTSSTPSIPPPPHPTAKIM